MNIDDESLSSRSRENRSAHLIGLVSDTHGLVRAGVHQALAGVELILHAGDVEGDDVLRELELIAPVKAVFGNCDDPGEVELSAELNLTFDDVQVHVSHGHELGSPTPEKLLSTYSSAVIVYGHTHRSLVTEADGRLVVNPGAAGPKRFRLPASVGLLTISGGHASVEIIAVE